MASGQFSDHSSPIQRWETNQANTVWEWFSCFALLLAFVGLIVAMFAKVFDCYFRYEGNVGINGTDAVLAEMDTPTFVFSVGSLSASTLSESGMFMKKHFF